MKKAIVIQAIIFVVAWFVMTPDQVVDNTHLFGLFGSYDLVRGNSIWVLLGAAFLSTLNIWLCWPKSQSVISNEKPVEDTLGAEAKAEETIDLDPKTPDLS